MKFYSLEGVDGAGKSSHVQWLADLFRGKGESVTVARDPGGTQLSERFRQMSLAKPMDVHAELLLIFACRRQLLSEVIEPALKRGDVVISDRFFDNSYAFQGGGWNVPYERIRTLDEWCAGPRPTLTFYFDLPVDVAMRRIHDTRTSVERQEREFHERVRTAYLSRATEEPKRVRVLDANRPMRDIRNEINSILSQDGHFAPIAPELLLRDSSEHAQTARRQSGRTPVRIDGPRRIRSLL